MWGGGGVKQVGGGGNKKGESFRAVRWEGLLIQNGRNTNMSFRLWAKEKKRCLRCLYRFLGIGEKYQGGEKHRFTESLRCRGV